MRKFGFTLSEILVALGIVGVIAAMTIPGVVNNYQKRAYVVQLRKIINDVSTAIDTYTMEEGKTKFQYTPLMKASSLEDQATTLASFTRTKFKVVKTCESEEAGCFADNYLSIDGNDEFELGSEDYASDIGITYLLADGSAIAPHRLAHNRFGVIIDINGTNGPNIGGRDIFYVVFNDTSTENYSSKDNCQSSAIGQGCYEQLVEDNWVMDY